MRLYWLHFLHLLVKCGGIARITNLVLYVWPAELLTKTCLSSCKQENTQKPTITFFFYMNGFAVHVCRHTKVGSLYVTGKLPTYPSPKLTLTLTSHLGQNVGLGEGRWAVSRKRIMMTTPLFPVLTNVQLPCWKAFLGVGRIRFTQSRGDWFESWQTSKLRTKILQVCDTQADRAQSLFFWENIRAPVGSSDII